MTACLMIVSPPPLPQTFTGPTRDYRGEAILYNRKTGDVHLARACLPVFPDLVRPAV
jgi:hypothetical protein